MCLHVGHDTQKRRPKGDPEQRQQAIACRYKAISKPLQSRYTTVIGPLDDRCRAVMGPLQSRRGLAAVTTGTRPEQRRRPATRPLHDRYNLVCVCARARIGAFGLPQYRSWRCMLRPKIYLCLYLKYYISKILYIYIYIQHRLCRSWCIPRS